MTAIDLLPSVPFTTAHAMQCHITRKELDRLVRERHVRRVLHGVYVLATVEDSILMRSAAASLVISPHCVACDRTAAWLQGIDTFEFRELEILPPLETYALRDHSRPRRRGCDGGTRDLRPSDVCFVDGLMVTTPVRTAIDLACKLRRHAALAALDAFMRVHGLSTSDLLREVARHAGRRGVVQARELVALADPKAESPGESWTRLEMLDRGLPAPQLQVWVYDDGREVFRLDLAYPQHKVAVEYDGREFHEGKARKKHDRLRRRWLRKHGWTVIVVTRSDFTVEAVDHWVGEVRDALRLAD